MPRAPAYEARLSPSGSREPNVLTDVEQSDAVVQREIFGPVVTVQRCCDEGEAIRKGPASLRIDATRVGRMIGSEVVAGS